MKSSLNASLADPIDGNKLELDSSINSHPKEIETIDLRNSHSKLDFENYEHFEQISILETRNQNCEVEWAKYESTIEKVNGIPAMSKAITRMNEEHVVRSLQSLEYVSKVHFPEHAKLLPEDVAIFKNDDRKLAVFDMDETLIHTLYKRNKNASEMKDSALQYDAKIPIQNANGSFRYLFINIRPYVMDVLRALKKWYRIVVFTASLKTYADAILNHLDPENDIFEGRYYRGQCHMTAENVYIKDLRTFTTYSSKQSKSWWLDDIVLIDNAAHSFGFQINNGIPMLPFYQDKEDKEMIYLYYYLKLLAKSKVISKCLQLNRIDPKKHRENILTPKVSCFTH